MDLDHSSIGYRIRTARLNSGLTQKQLAFQVHVTSPYLATVERGLKNASEALLKRIAAVTEAPLEWLIDGVGVPNMPMGQYDADILSGILTRNVLGMSLNDAIAGGYAYMVQQSFNQEAFCILSAGENHEQVFYAFHGCERMSVDKLDFDSSIYSFGTAKLVQKHGKYFLHIPVTSEVAEVAPSDICNVVGIDRGINFLVATYDSKHKAGFVSGRAVKQRRAKYKQIRKDLQQCGTPSSRRRLKAIGQRENRWMQDVNHCVSKALVENNPEHTLFVLEDLTGIRHATERVKRKGRYVSVSWSFYDLEQKLKYKAARNHSMVINVSPKYTSQTCPICGHTERGNRDKKRHLFTCCNCGYHSNDDRIGAMNLYRMGINYLTDKQVPDTVTREHVSFVKGAVNHPAM